MCQVFTARFSFFSGLATWWKIPRGGILWQKVNKEVLLPVSTLLKLKQKGHANYWLILITVQKIKDFKPLPLLKEMLFFFFCYKRCWSIFCQVFQCDCCSWVLIMAAYCSAWAWKTGIVKRLRTKEDFFKSIGNRVIIKSCRYATKINCDLTWPESCITRVDRFLHVRFSVITPDQLIRTKSLSLWEKTVTVVLHAFTFRSLTFTICFFYIFFS